MSIEHIANLSDRSFHYISMINFSMINYELIGKIAVAVLILTIFLNFVAVLIGLYCIKRKKILFPRFVLFILYMFYSPLKWLFSVFSVNEYLIDEILIDIQNAVYLEAFRKNSERKIILLPQCLRNSRCRARCDPLFGYTCRRCGLCDIGRIDELAEQYGYKVFIIPGGSFIQKIMTEYKPTSCIGVACPIELSDAMVIGAKIPVQGVYLEKDGCFETSVNIDDIVEKMDLGKKEDLPEEKCGCAAGRCGNIRNPAGPGASVGNIVCAGYKPEESRQDSGSAGRRDDVS